MTEDKARLMLKLADYLQNFREPTAEEGGVGFDMASFFDDSSVGYDETDREWFLGEHPCGTSACALGHAGMMPCFNEVGLKTDREEGWVIYKSPDGTTWLDFDAAQALFDISDEESGELFGAHSVTAQEEAAVLRNFVKGKFPDLVEAS